MSKISLLSCLAEEELSDDETEEMSQFVDKFICCSTDPDDIKKLLYRVDENARDKIAQNVASTVQEVNTHHHTKSCRKHNTKCRFNFPKLPCKRTILTQPMSQYNCQKVVLDENERVVIDQDNQPKMEPASEDEKYRFMKENQKLLEAVKDVLTDKIENNDCSNEEVYKTDETAIDYLLSENSIDLIFASFAKTDLKNRKFTTAKERYERYEEALKTSTVSHSVVLKRHPKDAYDTLQNHG